MKHYGSSPYSQQTLLNSCREPDETSSHPHTIYIAPFSYYHLENFLTKIRYSVTYRCMLNKLHAHTAYYF